MSEVMSAVGAALNAFNLDGSIDLGHISMTPEEFSHLKAHPTQRETSIHALSVLKRGVLSTSNAQHARAAAMLFDPTGANDAEALGALFVENPSQALATYGYKADGHTRDLLWSTGRAAAPPSLDISVTAVSSMAEAVRLYSAFDSIVAAKGQADSMISTLEAAGVTPVSDLFRNPRWLRSSLDLIWSLEHGRLGLRVPTSASPAEAPEPLNGDSFTGAVNFDEEVAKSLPYLPLVTTYADALRFLDQQHMTKKMLPLGSSFLAAYAAIIRRDGEEGERFIESLFGATGSSSPAGMDAIHAIKNATPRIEASVKNRRAKAAGRIQMTLAVTLNAYEAHRTGQLIAPYPALDAFTARIVSVFNPVRKAKKTSSQKKALVATESATAF